MKPVVLHCFDYFNRGGVELGICALIKNGFYQDLDLHVLALARGEGVIESEMARMVGAGHVQCLLERDSLIENGHLTQELVTHLIGRLSQEMDRLKPDALILSLPITNVVGRLAAMSYPHLRVVSFEHFAYKDRSQQMLTETAHRCDAVFGDTPETLRAMRASHPMQRPEYHVPMVILKAGTPRRLPKPSCFRLLSLGRLMPQKNYTELLHGLATLAKEGYGFTMTFVGEGSERPMLESLAQALGLAERVAFPGFEPDPSKLENLRNEAHIYVQSSLVEGFCLSVAEALAAGMVVVATDTGGVRDYGVDDHNMLITKGFSRDDLADRLRHAMNAYTAIAAPMSAAAIKTAQERFSQEVVCNLWKPAREILLAG